MKHERMAAPRMLEVVYKRPNKPPRVKMIVGTRMQDDPITANIRAVLDDAPGVAYAMEIDYEQETGFLHISFTCDGV